MAFYVSGYDAKANAVSITDTTDGVTDVFTKEVVFTEVQDAVRRFQFTVDGIDWARRTIMVVQAVSSLVEPMVKKIGDVVWNKVSTFTVDDCKIVAEKGHFKTGINNIVKTVAPAQQLPEMQALCYERIYNSSIQEVIKSAAQYTNTIQAIDVRNVAAVKQALYNQVCLVLQLKTNGLLTAFICTANLGIMDTLYGARFIDKLYLTKQLYGYMAGVDKLYVRADTQENKQKDDNMLSVCSCSLRFRQEKTKNGSDMELSSPFYTVNTNNLLAMYALNNPATIGNVITALFADNTPKTGYKFSFGLYSDIEQCLVRNVNDFEKPSVVLAGLQKYFGRDSSVDMAKVDIAITKFKSDWGYMQYLRNRGYSF